MLRVRSPLAVGFLLYVAAGSVQALGFGKVSNATVLGQPLNLSAMVRLGPDETLAADCVSVEVQSGENRIAKELVRMSVEPATDPAERHIRITTSSLIDEPVVTINLSAGCQARMSRRFVVFVDPPEIALAQSQPAADSSSLPTQKIESPTAPALALAQQPKAERPKPTAAASSPAPKVAPRTRSRNRIVLPEGPPKAVVAPASAPPQPSERSTTVAVKPPPKASEPVSRLKLEAPVAGVGRAASAPAMVPNAAEQASAAAAAAQSRAEAASAELARERQRLQALEENLSRLLRESQSTQASLATLQAKLREAESQRGMPSQMLYGLGGLSGLLALAVALLGWQLLRARRQAKWWDESVAASRAAEVESKRAPDAKPAAAEPAKSKKAVQPAAPAAAAAAAAAVVAPAAARVTADRPKDDAPPAFEESGGALVGEASGPGSLNLRTGPRRELSVEELIDLEQQAEFFIILGQDDAAIDLLMNHVRSTGGISPLPYMKLLEIYRRLGDAAAYERIRERFNRRFNAYAPEWGSDLSQGRTIEGYPQIITRLQTLWPNPVRVMETLDASLFRRDNEDETFELPAYRDLLFLYSIARDLAERAVAADDEAVDLLLPMGGPDAEAALPAFATADARRDPQDLSLDLDVSLPSAIEFTAPPAGKR